jgi:hypothetical protein
MHLTYKKIGFAITLAKKVNFITPIPFLFRSIIGYQLRKMCCITHNAVCSDCMFNVSCIYGLTFESIVPKNNTVMTGRDRISHPIILDADNFAGEALDSLLLNLVLLGSTIPYFPYFYHALKKGGESGITKERVPYQVNDIVEYLDTGKERSLMIDENNIETQLEGEKWECRQEAETIIEKCVMITLLTPLRFKAQGQYANRLVETELAGCLHRRTQVLCSQYGQNDHSGEYKFAGGWTVAEQNLKWQDFVHYSARQKKAMQLGGLVGNFVLSGKFTPYELGFLQFAEKFHAGKNTNFGLGKIKVSEYGRS